MDEIFEKTKRFIYQNARPIDLFRWQYHFENGTKENVIKSLSAYQNEDGGFGYALEADCWNPTSAPIQTWAATEILKEINWKDKKHLVVQDILRYLESGESFQNGKWVNTISSNNDFPHAVWWGFDGESERKNAENYNPTVCLAGFVLAYADENSRLYSLASSIAREAVETYLKQELLNDMHLILCYVRLMEYCEASNHKNIFDFNALKEKLSIQVHNVICQDKEEWKSNYVCKPSQFLTSQSSLFYEKNREIAEYEHEYILNTQLSDGSWDVAWQWWTDYPKEWAISKNWWKASIAITNINYLRGLEKCLQ